MVWSSFETNQDISATNWATNIENKSKFTVQDTNGEAHTLIVCYDDSAESGGLISELPRHLVLWRWTSFGPRNILSAFANSSRIKFRFEDQQHWFDGSGEVLILQPHRVIPVKDTNGTMRNITRPEPLPTHMIDAFYAWLYFLNDLCRQLFGVHRMFGDTGQYQISHDPDWFFNHVQEQSQPVGPGTEVQDCDWRSDAIAKYSFEDYLKEYHEEQQAMGGLGRDGKIWRTKRAP